MNSNSIERSLPIVATTLCNRFGVDITLCGNEAKTDGKTIFLPSLLESKLDPTILYGFLLHESGHVRLSSFGLGTKYPRLASLHHAILNILEDGRIEREMSNLYAGGLHWIKTMDAYTLRDKQSIGHPACFQKANKSPLEIFINYLFFWTRINFVGLGSLYGEGFAYSETEFLQRFGANVQTQLNRLLEKSLKAGSTRLISSIADEIIELLLNLQKNVEKQQQFQPQQNQRNKKAELELPSGEPVAVPCPSQSSNDSQNESNETDQEGNTPADATTTGLTPQSAITSVLGADGKAVQTACRGTDAAQAVADALTSEAGETSQAPSNRMGYMDVSTVIQGLKQSVSTDCMTMDQLEIDSVIQAGKTIALRLERSLRTRIEARNRTGVFHTHSGRTLNTRRLASFVTGNTKVFDRKIEKREVNTAIEIMLDMSGSMRRGGVHLAAKKAAIAFALATRRIPGVDVGVCTFSDVMCSDRPKVQSHIEHKEAQIKKALTALAAYQPRGGTPCAEAVIASVFRLLKCKKSTRHILFFITDGDVNEAIPMIKRLKAANIESRALFITKEALPHVFDHETRLSAMANSDVITESIIDLMSESVLS